MANRNLQNAYKLMEQGQKKEAAALVREELQTDKNNPDAWWLMSMLLEDEDKKVRALERVLSINPNHQAARAKLVQMRPDRQTGQNVMATQEMMNLDWSKLKDDPHPDKRKEKEPTTDDHKVATYAMMALGGFVLLVIVLVAALFVVNTIRNQRLAPDKTVKAYIDAQAALDFDRVRALTCQQYQSDVDIAEQAVNNLRQGFANMTIDVSGISATTTSETADAATVAVSGTMVISDGQNSQSFDIATLSDLVGDDANVSLILENNEWRICEPMTPQ